VVGRAADYPLSLATVGELLSLPWLWCSRCGTSSMRRKIAENRQSSHLGRLTNEYLPAQTKQTTDVRFG
jgi:hypothetical protein